MEDWVCLVCGKAMDSQKAIFVWGYDMWVHKACFLESEEGWAVGEARIIEHLKVLHIPCAKEKLPRLVAKRTTPALKSVRVRASLLRLPRLSCRYALALRTMVPH